MISVKIHDISRIQPDFFPDVAGQPMFGTVATYSEDGEVSTFYYNTDEIRRHIAALEDLARQMDEHQKTEGEPTP